MFKKLETKVDEIQWKIGLWGGPKVGKTTFALQMPDPIVVLDLEGGLEFGALALKESKEIYAYNPIVYKKEIVKLPEGGKQEILVIDYKKTVENIEYTVGAMVKFAEDNKEKRGTFVIDSSTELNDIFKIWNEERPEALKKDGKILRFEYQYVKKMNKKVWWPLVKTGWNIVLIGREKDKTDNKGNTIGTVADWHTSMGYNVDFLIYMKRLTPDMVQCEVLSRHPKANGIFTNLTFEKLKELVLQKG